MKNLSPDKETYETRTSPSTNGDTSFPQMLGNLAGQVSKLARQEVRLAKAEIKQTAKQSAKDSVGIIIGGVTLHAGVLTLVATLSVALAAVMPLWGALLLVSAILLISGAAITKAAIDKLQDDTSLEHLPESLKTNKEFLKEQVA